MQERRHSLIAIRSIQIPLILQSVLASFILINVVLIIAFLLGEGLSDPVGRLYLAIAVAAVEIICLVGVFLAARKQSSRIVGPVYRIGELASRLKEGDLTARANTRDDDYFADQVNVLNDAIQAIHDRLQGVKEEARNVGENSEQSLPDSMRQELEWFRTSDQS